MNETEYNTLKNQIAILQDLVIALQVQMEEVNKRFLLLEEDVERLKDKMSYLRRGEND